MEKLAKFFYGWLLDGSEPYSSYFTRESGWLLCFVIMLTFAGLAAAIFYFGLASKVKGATASNCIWTYLFGYIALFFFTPLIFQAAFDDCNIWDFWLEFVWIGLWNWVCYTIVFQVLSLGFSQLPWTKARNITLWTAVFK